jgi:phosphoribosyl 1,2-cyclic phosphodiesterase
MRFTNLSSGSTGNATIVNNHDVTLLVDVGFGVKRMDQLLNERGISGNQLDGILITHEHIDHIKGLGAFVRKYDVPIYANEKTWEVLHSKIGEIDDKNKKIMETDTIKDFGSLRVESFGVSHDAQDPVGYCFYDQELKLSLVTDLGYLSAKVKEKIVDSEVIVLETNHDVEMVRMGRYPWHIKQRILGDKGHLSNESAAEGLADVLSGKTTSVYMGHISQNHNQIDIARLTIHDVLKEHGVSLKDCHVRLMDTYYNRPTEWDDLQRVDEELKR